MTTTDARPTQRSPQWYALDTLYRAFAATAVVLLAIVIGFAIAGADPDALRAMECANAAGVLAWCARGASRRV